MLDLENQIFRQIEKSKSILVVFKLQENDDSLAASLGIFLFLKKIGKETEVIGIGEKTDNNLSFLPNFSEIKSKLENIRRFIVSLSVKNATVNQIKYSLDDDKLNFIISPSAGWFSPEDVSAKAGDFRYDLIITIGLSDLESLGEAYDENIEFFYKTTVINIDNKAGNEEFGQVNFIDLNTAANSEIIYYLLKNYRPEDISEEAATCLLAGIIKKTRNFKVGNLTPKTLLAGSELISRGAEREKIIKNLFHSKSFDSLKAWGEILNKLKSENEGELLWSKLENAGADFILSNLDEMVDELVGSLPKAKYFAVFKKNGDGKTTLRLFSLNGISANEIALYFGGSGNRDVAEALFNQNINEASSEAIKTIIEKVNKKAS